MSAHDFPGFVAPSVPGLDLDRDPDTEEPTGEVSEGDLARLDAALARLDAASCAISIPPLARRQ